MTLAGAQLSATVGILADAARAPAGLRAFAGVAIDTLARHIGADLTTLSVCDLCTGRRRVVSTPAGALRPTDIATFDRLFGDHPLVRFHATRPGAGTHRISDSLPMAQFRRTELYADYYRAIGVEHAVAVPLYVDDRRLVSIVLNRAARDFRDDDVAALDFVRGPLAALFRQVVEIHRLRAALHRAVDAGVPATPTVVAALTPREREVLDWVAAGKSDADIAGPDRCCDAHGAEAPAERVRQARRGEPDGRSDARAGRRAAPALTNGSTFGGISARPTLA